MFAIIGLERFLNLDMNSKDTAKTGEHFPATGQWIVKDIAPGADDLIHKGADMIKSFKEGDIVPQFENKNVVWQFVR